MIIKKRKNSFWFISSPFFKKDSLSVSFFSVLFQLAQWSQGLFFIYIFLIESVLLCDWLRQMKCFIWSLNRPKRLPFITLPFTNENLPFKIPPPAPSLVRIIVFKNLSKNLWTQGVGGGRRWCKWNYSSLWGLLRTCLVFCFKRRGEILRRDSLESEKSSVFLNGA